MQSVFERYLERMEQAGTPEIASFERSRSSPVSSALLLLRRRRVNPPIASDAPLSNDRSSARAEARASANVGQRHGASACLCARQALTPQRRQFGGIITAMRITAVPPTPNHSFKRTVNGLRPSPAA
jgi:hypothetical protein